MSRPLVALHLPENVPPDYPWACHKDSQLSGEAPFFSTDCKGLPLSRAIFYLDHGWSSKMRSDLAFYKLGQVNEIHCRYLYSESLSPCSSLPGHPTPA
jgi:hypothetical protein